MMSSLTDLLPEVVPLMAGCPEGAIMQALRIGCREFCKKTELWIEERSFDLVEDQDEYSIYSSWDANIMRLREVRINTTEGIANNRDGAVQNPASYEFKANRTLKFYQAPTSSLTDGLEVKMSLAPSVTCNDNDAFIDPEFLDQYYNGPKSYAIFYLKSQKGTRYYDPAGSQMWYTEWNKAVRDGRFDFINNTTTNISKAKPPEFI